jgi:hypothetical protein
MTRKLIVLILATIAVAAAGLLVWTFVLKGGHDIVLGLTAFAIAAITFYGTMMLNLPKRGRRSLDKVNLRTGIASSTIVTYLFIMCLSTFAGGPAEMGSLTETFITSFTGLVGTTVAFYFGAEAATQIFGRKDAEDNDTDEQGDEH